jgi:MFS family permease
MFSMFLYLTLYIQNVLGYGPLQAGLRFLPVTLLSFAVAPVAGRLSVRMPVRLLLGGGLVLVGAGLLLMTAITPTSGWTTLIPGFVLAGAGVGMINPPLASTAIGVVPPARSGMASGINNTFRQVGIATGIAGLGAVFQHQLVKHTTSLLVSSGQAAQVLHAAHGNLTTSLESGNVAVVARTLTPAGRVALSHAFRTGFTDALTTILLIAAAVALTGAVLGFALVRSGDFVASGVPERQPSGEPASVPAA